MRYTFEEQQCRNLEFSGRREWLLTNGIGGYAMGTIAGLNSRRYHGLLIAATQPPAGRILLCSNVDIQVQSAGNPIGISTNQYPGAVYPEGYLYLTKFEFDEAARWSYRVAGQPLEKRLFMVPGKNITVLELEHKGKTPVSVTMRPFVCHRDHHSDFHETDSYPSDLKFFLGKTVVEHKGSALVLAHPGGTAVPAPGWYYRFEHQKEAERGLPDREDQFSPCEILYDLVPGQTIRLQISLGEANGEYVCPPVGETTFKLAEQLACAAKHYVVQTPDRVSILAGYPWFTDWGRDTMISLPGILLATQQYDLARTLLLDYAKNLKNGLIPNRFMESGSGADYNTVDATLWFGNAVYKTLVAEWNEEFAKQIFPVLEKIVKAHEDGTDFGIKVDARDGLLSQGGEGHQLTWMDAKVGDWVITPRHGKPVEINGLWINLLGIIDWLQSKLNLEGRDYESARAKANASFEEKFWKPSMGFYLDTVDPMDATLRPNQAIAMSLPFLSLDPARADQALTIIAQKLLTQVGLRTLDPDSPEYKGKFKGTMPERDAAYHQGTVWPWLLGPYCTSIVRYQDGRLEAKRILREAKQLLTEYGIGGIAEVYDGDGPHGPGGCPWQAWSIAEILRVWTEDIGGE